MPDHPIQTARREFENGYRAYLGRTHYIMLELQRQQAEAPETPEPKADGERTEAEAISAWYAERDQGGECGD